MLGPSSAGDNVVSDAEVAKAFELYCKWLTRRSNDEATRSLKKITKDGQDLLVPLTGRELRNDLLLALYFSMEKPSVPALWNLVNELVRRAPQQPWPRQSLDAFERHMSRLLAQRRRR